MFSIIVGFFVLSNLNCLESANTEYSSVIQQIFEDELPSDCINLYKKLSPLSMVKMFDASTKLITNGLMDGNFVDLGSFDECLEIADEDSNIYGKYCLTTVDLKTFLSKFYPNKSDLTTELINQTQMKIREFENSKVLGTQISSLLDLYTLFARFGFCIPDKCKLDKVAVFKFDDDKCYTKYTNKDMDFFPFFVLILLYIFVLISVLSTFYDMIIENLSMKPKHEILVAFSLYTNGKKLLSTHSSANQLSCLNGLKVFSMIWVVLGHSYLNMFSTSFDNVMYIDKWMDNPINMLVLSATVSVDTFFTIGGLLTVYTFMNSPPKETKQSLKNIPIMYLHRYLRLTPAFAVIVLIYASGLIKYFGSGPKWYTLNSEINNCRENWWAALLYVQNYMDYSKICVVQSWYLSADFQLFLITPFVLIPLRRYPKYIIPALYVIAVIGMIIPFFLGYTNKWTGVGLGSSQRVFADNYYFVTHARFAPYFIGMIAGYYIHKAKKGSKLSNIPMGYVLLLWLVTFCGIFGCIFDGFKLLHNSSNAWVDGLYMGFNRSAWSLSISLLIFLCSTGNGGPIQKFLSLPVFHVMAKLTYTMYLVHFIVIVCMNGASRNVLHFSNFSVITYFFAHFSITLIISLFHSLIFESPMISIERLLFPSARSRANKELPK